MSHKKTPVAVLAGTPVDTQMGADVLNAHGLTALNCPVSRFPLEQAAFQVKPPEEKQAVLTEILRTAPIRQIFVNGGTAAKYYEKYQQQQTGVKAVRLPSTSPANAAWSLERLTEAWAVIAEPAQQP